VLGRCFSNAEEDSAKADDAKLCEAIEMEAWTADDSTCAANVIFTGTKPMITVVYANVEGLPVIVTGKPPSLTYAEANWASPNLAASHFLSLIPGQAFATGCQINHAR
jgi:hypothetical protein